MPTFSALEKPLVIQRNLRWEQSLEEFQRVPAGSAHFLNGRFAHALFNFAFFPPRFLAIIPKCPATCKACRCQFRDMQDSPNYVPFSRESFLKTHHSEIV